MLKPNEVKTEHIANGAVTTPKIADEAVTARKLDERSVTTEKLATGAVTGSKIAENAVTGSKIRDNTVRAEKIAAGAVTTAKIGEQQVTGSRIKDKTITADKLASNCVTTEKIANGSVTKSKLSFELPEPGEVARPITPPLTSAELGTGSVESEKIQDGAVTQEKLAPGVGGSRIEFVIPSVEVLYLTDVTADIPYTTLDLSAWVPAGAKGVIVQLGVFNQAYATGRAFFRVRTNADQRDALGVGMMVGGNSMVANQGIVPVTSARTIEYALESVGGPWVATLTLYITIVGYII